MCLNLLRSNTDECSAVQKVELYLTDWKTRRAKNLDLHWFCFENERCDAKSVAVIWVLMQCVNVNKEY